MVASNRTLDRVLEVVLKHVDENTAFKIVDELRKVDGNKSFRDSIEVLYNKIVHHK